VRSTVLQDSSSGQRRGEGSFGVAGHQSCISYRSPRALDNSGYRVHCRDCRQRFRLIRRGVSHNPRPTDRRVPRSRCTGAGA
jgi:hypothetical protein